LRWLKWIVGSLFAPIALAVLFISVFGWNWLRAPIERVTLEKTGRVLVIGGDIEIDLAWPLPRIRSGAVSFSNPSWATEKQMVSAAAATVSIDLPQLLQRNLVFPEVRLQRPAIFLEQSNDGRKNWLLDRQQQDESARIRIDRLMLDLGTLGYDDVTRKTHIRATLSTANTQPGKAELAFTAQGKYKNLPFKAQGHGGPVLGLRDEMTPYPLSAELTVGRTVVKATGSITSLLKFTAMDMQLDLRGDNLAQLYPLLGIAFPATRAYVTHGHVVHSKQQWRYEKFSGRIGASDIAGTFQVDTGGKRRAMQGNLVSNLFDIADLGPLIGLRPGSLQAARKATPATAHVLPDLPFKAERWDSVDAEVTLHARTLRHAKALPLENLKTHLSLRDAVLTLDPLDFGLAGGQLQAMISLDGRRDPIQAHARIKARTIQLARLFPSIKLNRNSIGQINGVLELKGQGDSVRSMLANADGKVGLVVARGEISQLMLEKAGIHLWEILRLNVTGDKLVKLRCGVADFDVKQGIMQANALVFDTEVTTLFGTGSIDLGQEKLDLTLRQKTKNTSPLALRSPIHIRGSFARPEVEVDKGQMTVRALGAIALGMLNPVLALIPLIDTDPGSDSDCAQLVRDARALPK
jgi:AsmA protein